FLGGGDFLLVPFLLCGRADGTQIVPVAVTADVVEEGKEPIIVLLRKRIDLVIVAAGASHGQAQESLAGGAGDVVEVIVKVQRLVRRFVVIYPQAVIAGGDERIGRYLVELIA